MSDIRKGSTVFFPGESGAIRCGRVVEVVAGKPRKKRVRHTAVIDPGDGGVFARVPVDRLSLSRPRPPVARTMPAFTFIAGE